MAKLSVEMSKTYGNNLCFRALSISKRHKKGAQAKGIARQRKEELWSHRESNSDLIFRRDLFYPLNYETNPAAKVICLRRKTKLFAKKRIND